MLATICQGENMLHVLKNNIKSNFAWDHFWNSSSWWKKNNFLVTSVIPEEITSNMLGGKNCTRGFVKEV